MLKGCICTVAISVGLLSRRLDAQQISGTAFVGNLSVPSAETSILLLDTVGTIVTGTITNAEGRFKVRAPGAGWFRVRARRVGFSPDSLGPLFLKAGDEVKFNPNLKQLTTSLAVVSVKGSERCIVRPGEGEIAFGLWEAAQSTLAGTAISSLGSQSGFVLERFRREIDPATKRVIRQTVWQTGTLSSEPYFSISADSLADKGFARQGGDSATYFAPDARTLISDVFSRTHCFRPITDKDKPDRIGLRFEPVSKTNVVDVAGVLWLDRASSELRSLEYQYTYGPNRETRDAGGRITYARLTNGLSIVTDWLIRVPVEKSETRTTPSATGSIADRSSLRTSHGSRVVALWEIGGTVKTAIDPNELAVGASSMSVVKGTLINEEDHRGLKGIVVELGSTKELRESRRMTTGDDGSFVFESVGKGDYDLSVPEPRFDTLNTPVVPVQIHVDPATEQTVTITVPGPNAGRASLCPSGVSPKAIVIHGVVTDSASGQPIAKARVRAYWLTDVQVGSRLITANPHELTTYTDPLGRYAFCSAEPTHRLLLSASVGALHSPRQPSLTVSNGETRLYDLRIANASGARPVSQ
jgi:hypothetical protein